jgi:hypothetical protein
LAGSTCAAWSIHPASTTARGGTHGTAENLCEIVEEGESFGAAEAAPSADDDVGFRHVERAGRVGDDGFRHRARERGVERRGDDLARSGLARDRRGRLEGLRPDRDHADVRRDRHRADRLACEHGAERRSNAPSFTPMPMQSAAYPAPSFAAA